MVIFPSYIVILICRRLTLALEIIVLQLAIAQIQLFRFISFIINKPSINVSRQRTPVIVFFSSFPWFQSLFEPLVLSHHISGTYPSLSSTL